jgi:hypothetical protein
MVTGQQVQKFGTKPWVCSENFTELQKTNKQQLDQSAMNAAFI